MSPFMLCELKNIYSSSKQLVFRSLKDAKNKRWLLLHQSTQNTGYRQGRIEGGTQCFDTTLCELHLSTSYYCKTTISNNSMPARFLLTSYSAQQGYKIKAGVAREWLAKKDNVYKTVIYFLAGNKKDP